MMIIQNIDLYSEFYYLVKQIPPGHVTTYGALARALGDPIAARAVGRMLSENPDPQTIPCHRVVGFDGKIGGFTHPEGIAAKIKLLAREGVVIVNNKIQNFEKILFDDFETNYPLKTLKKQQQTLATRVLLEDVENSRTVTGVDVAYYKRRAFVAFVEFDLHTTHHIQTQTYITQVDFPYIPTYLSYREGPPILEHVPEDTILMVDGNGILHPLNFGIASYIGVIKDIPTIGVAKSKLCGTVVGEKIMLNNKYVGIKFKKNYISPGHKITITTAFNIIKRFTVHARPTPAQLAHKAATALRNEYCRSHCRGPF